MTNELKEETQKLVSDLKEDMNKQLKEPKEIQTGNSKMAARGRKQKASLL
jgi:hypothetical protein